MWCDWVFRAWGVQTTNGDDEHGYSGFQGLMAVGGGDRFTVIGARPWCCGGGRGSPPVWVLLVGVNEDCEALENEFGAAGASPHDVDESYRVPAL